MLVVAGTCYASSVCLLLAQYVCLHWSPYTILLGNIYKYDAQQYNWLKKSIVQTPLPVSSQWKGSKLLLESFHEGLRRA